MPRLCWAQREVEWRYEQGMVLARIQRQSWHEMGQSSRR
jgi:hypothetical protein